VARRSSPTPGKGLDTLLAPGREIILARDAPDVLAALRAPEPARQALAAAARARILAAHTGAHRAAELERPLDEARARGRRGQTPRRMTAIPSPVE
jgi:spore maturation protein CgeB